MATEPKRVVRAEHRLPAVIAIVIVLVLYALLPSTFLPGIRYGVVGIAILLLIPVLILNPARLTRQTRWSRVLSVSNAFLLGAANQIALVQLVYLLVNAGKQDGPSLLIAAVQVWVTNVIVFALIYWEIDRGGPVARRHEERRDLDPADFRFPQDEDHDAITEVAIRSSAKSDWAPGYVDYLYFSLSNSMAFSPTDAMPLSHRAKALMGLESFAGFVILALVIARAVSLLG
ncbi:putative membrane protein [Glaciihabitans tibetensis]|uniref:Putative membrane protein n=1 Tax=Glaciihabitans tibetensis TaxID=1266600 RepID=A0A2T0VA57_9MICO|nr:DUF1345 domain-containing protein [Glaciihabitans tibetensis]PRY67076.1 putative membrane protein [Glaciihabitans tibetensis]